MRLTLEEFKGDMSEDEFNEILNEMIEDGSGIICNEDGTFEVPDDLVDEHELQHTRMILSLNTTIKTVNQNGKAMQALTEYVKELEKIVFKQNKTMLEGLSLVQESMRFMLDVFADVNGLKYDIDMSEYFGNVSLEKLASYCKKYPLFISQLSDTITFKQFDSSSIFDYVLQFYIVLCTHQNDDMEKIKAFLGEYSKEMTTLASLARNTDIFNQLKNGAKVCEYLTDIFKIIKEKAPDTLQEYLFESEFERLMSINDELKNDYANWEEL